VALKDLSLGGATFTSPIPLEPGDRAQLHTSLGELPFHAVAEVRRLERRPAADGTAYAVSAAFVSMPEESQQGLAAFLTSSNR
jgi:hypothetical protein